MRHAFRIFLSHSGLSGLWVYAHLALVAPAATGLELYRCARNGEVEFRQTPCPDGVQTRTEVTNRNRGMTPIEPALRLPKKPKAKSSEQKPSKRNNEERCWRAGQRLEKVERRLRGGYKASQYESLHQKQEEYSDYLKRYCR